MALTATQTATFTYPSGYQSTSFRPFEADGIFVAARVTVTGRLVGTLALENTDTQPVSVSAAVAARLSAGGYFLTPSPDLSSSATVALAAYDGTADFAGGSGVSSLMLDSGQVSADQVYTGDLLRLFQSPFPLYFQPGIYPIELTTSGGSLRQRYAATGEMTVSVQYEYTPFSITSAATTTLAAAATSLPAAPSATATGLLTMTSAVQTTTLVARPAGWQDTATVARFDAALGTLKSVNIRLAGTLVAGAEIGGQNYSQSLRQEAKIGLALAGGGSALADLRLDTGVRYLYDYSTTPHLSQSLALAGNTGITLSDSAALAPFIGAGALDLAVDTSGTTSFDVQYALLAASVSLQTGARLEVSYTYEPAEPVAPIAMTNVTSGAAGTPTPLDYAGPVAGILHEFAAITPDNIALSAGTDSWYVRTGDGNDAIRVSGGVNVVDGGGGSNFLTGGAGTDTFLVDAQWVAAPIWTTIANLGPGDSATVWGITQSYHALSWRDGQGAAGNEGLTLHARVPGGPPASMTLVGYTRADLDNGRLTSVFGTSDGIPYFHIAAA